MGEQKRKTIIAINFLYSLISAATTVLLPLYLLEKGFDIAEMGVIFSLLPLVMLVCRTVFAMIADIIGTGKIFIINGLAGVASAVTYAVATSPVVFSLGKVFEGLYASAFWAVNRTEIYKVAGKRKEGEAASFMLGMRTAAGFLGRIGIGFSIALVSFEKSLLALVLLSTIMLYFSSKIKNSINRKITTMNVKGLLFKRESRFWQAFAVNTISAPREVLTTFLLPVYLATVLKMGAAEVGTAIALYSITYAVAILSVTRYKLPLNRTALLSFLFGVFPLLFLPYVDVLWTWALVAAIGIGWGLSGALFEHVIAEVVKGSRAVSTDVAILHIPFKIVETTSFMAIGFLILSFGFATMFTVIGIITALYIIAAWRFLRNS